HPRLLHSFPTRRSSDLTELALIYGRNPDRSRLDLEFINPHFFSRRTLINARYSDLSDGHRGQWQFGLPFHETAAPHSVETYGELDRKSTRLNSSHVSIS